MLSVDKITSLLPFARNKSSRELLMRMYLMQYIEPPVIPNVIFCLDAHPHANALLDFRFDVTGIKKMGYLLGIPATIITPAGSRICRDEAMCILLSRLTFPRHYHGMALMFGRSRAQLGDVFLYLVHDIYDRWDPIVFLNRGLLRSRMTRYCAAIARKGSPLDCVFGFINGTK
ncbi:hypothetical protein H310_15124, partial [Aphanomyces invadans]